MLLTENQIIRRIEEAYKQGILDGRTEMLREEIIRMDAARKLKTLIDDDDIDNKIAVIKAECEANHIEG